jgi:hypothetical protein
MLNYHLSQKLKLIEKCEFTHLINTLTIPNFNKRPYFSTYSAFFATSVFFFFFLKKIYKKKREAGLQKR